MGMSFWNPDDRRGRHALARGPPAAPAHPAHLGPRGPGQPARRRDGRAQADPARPRCMCSRNCGHWAQIEAAEEFREVATAFLARHVGEAATDSDDRHQVAWATSGSPAPTSTQWKHFAGKVLGLAEGRGPDPDNLYYRIDEVSARLVVVPVRRRPARLRRLGARRPPGARRTAREHLQEGRRRVRGGHARGARRAPGAGAGPVHRPVRQRLRAVPRHHLRVAAGRHAVRRDVRHRRPGHGPRRASR